MTIFALRNIGITLYQPGLHLCFIYATHGPHHALSLAPILALFASGT